MKLTSAAFADGGDIPARHACDGEDLSPALAWSGLPKATKSLALVVEDPDAPAGTWVHWVAYDLPAALNGLPEGLPEGETLPVGGSQGASWGVDSFEKSGWAGPCPPPGKPHRYVFTLYALSAPTGLEPGQTKLELLEAIEETTLATATLTGLYGR